MTQVNFGFSLIVDYELCKVVSFLIYALKILVGIANIKISTLKPINVFPSIQMWMIMKYICTSYIWWGLYKTFLCVAVHVLGLMEPARTTKELFIVLLLLKKSFNIIVYLIKVISLRIAQNTKFRKFWDGPWIRKRIIFSIQVSLFSVRWRTFLSTWRTQ